MNPLYIIVPVMLIGIAILWINIRAGNQGKRKKVKKDHRARQEHAVWAWTTVISSKSGPVSGAGFAHVEMELEVHLPGSKPYMATTTWLVEAEALSYVETGKEVPVRIDPEDPKYIYPNGPWAKYVE